MCQLPVIDIANPCYFLQNVLILSSHLTGRLKGVQICSAVSLELDKC